MLFAVITHVFQNGTCACLVQFATFVNIAQMLSNCRTLGSKQLRYLLLSKPYGFIASINLYFKTYAVLITDYWLLIIDYWLLIADSFQELDAVGGDGDGGG